MPRARCRPQDPGGVKNDRLSGHGSRAATHQPRLRGHCASAGLGAPWRARRFQRRRGLARNRSQSAIALGEQGRAVPPGALADLDQAQRPGHGRMTVRRRAASKKMRAGNRPDVHDEGGVAVAMPAFAPSDISRDGPRMSGQRRQPSRPAPGNELQPRLIPRTPSHRHAFLTVADKKTSNINRKITHTESVCLSRAVS